MVFFLETTKRPIYWSRRDENDGIVLGKPGGDSLLSSAGGEYAKTLAKYVHAEIHELYEDGSFRDGKLFTFFMQFKLTWFSSCKNFYSKFLASEHKKQRNTLFTIVVMMVGSLCSKRM